MDGTTRASLTGGTTALLRALGVGVLALGLSPIAGQAPDRSPSPSRRSPRQRSFIVAFELAADRPGEFVWPHPSFRPASYSRVLLVADRMPRVRYVGRAGEPGPLSASRHLRINGRLREPEKTSTGPSQPRNADRAAEFVVDLEAGRLRLLLLMPPGAAADAGHETAHITLYEVGPPQPSRLPPQSGEVR